MKRLACLFLVMILALISVSALAEQFTLRDGIQFGMSIDEIKKIEQEAGYEVEESSGYHDGSDDDVYLTLNVDNLCCSVEKCLGQVRTLKTASSRMVFRFNGRKTNGKENTPPD